MNPGSAILRNEKQKSEGGDEEGKSSKGGGKPDFLDLDKMETREEPMKKAAKRERECTIL